jgi:hypothetical protein
MPLCRFRSVPARRVAGATQIIDGQGDDVARTAPGMVVDAALLIVPVEGEAEQQALEGCHVRFGMTGWTTVGE